MLIPNGSGEVWQTIVDASGRVLLPVELRRELNAVSGTAMVWVKNESGIHLKTFEQSLSEIQDYYESLSPPDDVWSEEILKRRREDASNG